MIARPGRRTWRIGGQHHHDATLQDLDRDLLDENTVRDALEHARKLQGLAPYTREEVKGCHTATILFRLVAAYDRLRESRSAKRCKAMAESLASSREENAEQKRELMRLWLMESKYKALKARAGQGDLFTPSAS